MACIGHGVADVIVFLKQQIHLVVINTYYEFISTCKNTVGFVDPSGFCLYSLQAFNCSL
ncbi:unnamed protein product, partial [Urochloa humidicola]